MKQGCSQAWIARIKSRNGRGRRCPKQMWADINTGAGQRRCLDHLLDAVVAHGATLGRGPQEWVVSLSTAENRPIILKVCLNSRQRGWVDFSFVLAELFGFRCWQHNPPVIFDSAEGSS